MSIIERLITALKAAWAKEPTVIAWTVAGVIVAVAAKAGIVLPEAGVAEAVASLIPFLLLGAVNRLQVVPKAKLRRRASDRPATREA